MIASVRSPATEFERRAKRAGSLAEAAQVSREPLLFASALCRAQSTVSLLVEEAHRSEPLTGRLAQDVERVLPLFTPVVAFAAEGAPKDLAQQARARLVEHADVASNRLLTMWSGSSSAREDYLSRALLRPYLEVLRAYGVSPERLHTQGHCPFCGGAPTVSSRKEMPDSTAAARVLHCALCGCEWNALRGLCLACGESDPERLPIYTSDAYPVVRIEACETCNRYIKSLDLTKDARLIPEIDDVASVSMDLWANEQGMTRIEPGLAGI